MQRRQSVYIPYQYRLIDTTLYILSIEELIFLFDEIQKKILKININSSKIKFYLIIRNILK